MGHTKRYHTFNDAEDAIKDQVLQLCETYSHAIKQLLPVLKKGQQQAPQSDQKTFEDFFNEGNDHLHNLVQLAIELKDISNENRGTILEISSEVLANTVKFLSEAPKELEKTSLFKHPS
ncbi:MAG: hypothetical protein VW397_01605 [Candidatus Margulisiibacteriota bacterium]